MDAWIIGSASTRFQKWPDRDFRDLTAEAVLGALADAAIEGDRIDQIWFGNCAMDVWGQSNIRGQVCLTPLQRSGVLTPRAPIGNVEGGCATGSLALHTAVDSIRSGSAGVALAVGVEKTFVPEDPAKSFQLFSGGIDQLHPDEWQTVFSEGAAEEGLDYAPSPHRVLFLDVHALHARHHMATYGTTAAQIATIASKNHSHGARNPKAQYRFEASVDQVLDDRPVIAPFTRAMCCPISDGAAAAVVVSSRVLESLPAAVRERAVRVLAHNRTGGAWRSLSQPNVVAHAGRAAYVAAGIGPDDVDLAEVHDATAFCELQATELLGFCARGEGGAYAESGATALGGERPINVSGGLVSKGHPLGATGLGMIDELVVQLRGEAGERQVAGEPAIALAHNAGGQLGFDEALCAVTILERR